MGRVRERLTAYGLAPSRARGQNFLRSAETAKRIVSVVELEPTDAVLEVGPGLGDLTRVIAQGVRRVVAFEVDHGLVRALADAGLPEHVEIRQQDALRADWSAIGAELGAPCVLMGNLPYRIAGRLIVQLLLDPEARAAFRRFGFMVQAEVADRLLATPGTPAYGVLSIWTRLYAEARRGLELGPDAFVPRPKVRSSFVVMDPKPGLEVQLDRAVLEQLVRASFQQRRKTLRRALHGWVPSAEDVKAALQAAQIDGQRRGETLDEQEFVRLAQALERQGVGG